jgi:hypothetical protein
MRKLDYRRDELVGAISDEQVSLIYHHLLVEENSLLCWHGATFFSRRMMTISLEQSLSMAQA